MLMRCHYWIFNTRNIRETIDSFTRGSYYHLFKRCVNSVHKNADRDQNEGVLGFSVLRFQLFFRSVFWFLYQKTSVFRFWCSLRFAAIPIFSIWFSVFAKNTSGFSDLISDAVFGLDIRCSFRIWYPMQFSDLISDAVFDFTYLTYLGSSFSSIWAAITRLH